MPRGKTLLAELRDTTLDLMDVLTHNVASIINITMRVPALTAVPVLLALGACPKPVPPSGSDSGFDPRSHVSLDTNTGELTGVSNVYSLPDVGQRDEVTTSLISHARIIFETCLREPQQVFVSFVGQYGNSPQLHVECTPSDRVAGPDDGFQSCVIDEGRYGQQTWWASCLRRGDQEDAILTLRWIPRMPRNGVSYEDSRWDLTLSGTNPAGEDGYRKEFYASSTSTGPECAMHDLKVDLDDRIGELRRDKGVTLDRDFRLTDPHPPLGCVSK